MKGRHNLMVFQLYLTASLLISSCSSVSNSAYNESITKTSEAADQLLLATHDLRAEISKKVDENPNSASQDFIVMVDEKSYEIEQIQTHLKQDGSNRSIVANQQAKFEKIRSYQHRLGNLSRDISTIHKSFEKELEKKLKSDIYFDTGSTQLSQTGISELKKIVFTDLNDIIMDWRKESHYQTHPLKIRLKITGHADLQGSTNLELRKKNNLAISEKRAEAVKSIINNYLLEIKTTQAIEIQIDSEGKGEEPPPGLLDVNLINNPERRACFISGYVIPIM
jgi:outer membrane protein OmpA-like peptidoglycan-associated protein